MTEKPKPQARYRLVLEYEMDDHDAPREVMRRLRLLGESVGGKVVEVFRLDPVWCDQCQKYHAGTDS